MKKIAHGLLALFVAAVLSACGATKSGPPPLTITDMGTLAAKGKAVVIISTEHESKSLFGSKGTGPMNTSWSAKDRKKDIALNLDRFLITSTTDMKKTPRIAEIAPGTYNLLTFSYSTGSGKMSNAAGMRGLPLASFTARAGDVVYLGNFVSYGEAFRKRRKFSFKLRVENHEQLARQHLATQAPALAAQMQTRLVKISPLFEVLQTMAKR